MFKLESPLRKAIVGFEMKDRIFCKYGSPFQQFCWCVFSSMMHRSDVCISICATFFMYSESIYIYFNSAVYIPLRQHGELLYNQIRCDVMLPRNNNLDDVEISCVDLVYH